MMKIKYNWILVGSLMLNSIYFAQVLYRIIRKIIANNGQITWSQGIVLMLVSFFVAIFFWAIFLFVRKRYAIKIDRNEIDFNLLGNSYIGKIKKEEIADVLYVSQKKIIKIEFINQERFIKSVRNPISRWLMNAMVKKEGTPVAFKSNITQENITEIKIYLDYYGYAKAESQLEIATLQSKKDALDS